MQIHEKLRVMRQCKQWTQEKLAEKLGWTINSYAKLERGEVNIKLDKLKKIAEIMGVNVEDFFNSSEKTVLNFAENCNPTNLMQGYNSPSDSTHIHIVLTETQCANELEKVFLILKEKEKEIEYLKQQVYQLKEIIQLMKNK